MHQNEGKGFSIWLVLIVMAVIGFVALFYKHIGPALIERAHSVEATRQEDMTIKELESMLSGYMSVYESGMLIYDEYHNSALSDNRREAEQQLMKARRACELYEETYKEHKGLAKSLPKDIFPEKLQ